MTSAAVFALGLPDLVPMPKRYEPLDGCFVVSGVPLHIELGNRQCELGAADVAARIAELGKTAGPIGPIADSSSPGIYLLTADSPAGATLIKELALDITTDDPGPQGYVIHPAGKRLLVIGSDSVGALYGAMTLRQMLRTDAAGSVSIVPARVYDQPDYRYRSDMSCGRGLRSWTLGETNVLAGYKAGIDWMARFKINLMSDYHHLINFRADARSIGAETRTLVGEINRYATARGIYPILWRNTSIGAGGFDAKRPEFQNWDCLAQTSHGDDIYYCWSRDDLARETITRTMRLFNECGFKILALHPVDGGGITDPEIWSRRCRECRRRFGNDRWRGSVHQFGLWSKAFKQTAAPDALFASCIYPYTAGYADFRNFKVPEELWRKNSVDYWQHVHDDIDPAIIPMSWMSRPDQMQAYREKFSGRPLFIYAHSFVPAGYFGSWHRLNGSNYSGDSRDLFYLAAGFYQHERWMNAICSGEYAWNTTAPGSEVFSGLYYDIERDHTEPPEVFEEWVPRVCRAFFGPELGTLLAPVYQAGVQNDYIMDPGTALANANKQRRKPMADVDPEDKEGKTSVAVSLPDLQDSVARMAAQVKATERAWDALQAAFPLREKIDPYRRRLLVHYYRRMPLWHLTARVRHALYTANAYEKANDLAGARQALKDGLRHFEADWQVANLAQEQSRSEKDMTALPPLHKHGDVRPVPTELKRELETRLAGLDAKLRPLE
ncbi:MAG: glycoside hydrolase family 20 zincin-like fold domain-containing protein [Kiritimatiellia bacterium]